jgi:hypothetical protein
MPSLLHKVWFLNYGCVNGAWKFTPLVRAMCLEIKRLQPSMMKVLFNITLFKWVIAIGISGEGARFIRPFGLHTLTLHGILNTCGAYACNTHTRPTRCTRRELAFWKRRNALYIWACIAKPRANCAMWKWGFQLACLTSDLVTTHQDGIILYHRDRKGHEASQPNAAYYFPDFLVLLIAHPTHLPWTP